MPATDFQEPISITFSEGRGYPIYFNALADVPALMDKAGLRRGRCVIVTDENVARHYRSPLEDGLRRAGWSPLTIVLPPGEETKSPSHLQTIYDAALRWGIDRKTPLLALGGGVVGDLAGFAAATLLRGLPLIQLPTTLIAQVDSALGGKTGINHSAGKNLIGAFYQPVFVCSDRSTLATLDNREWTSGLAEVVKHALIADCDFFDFVEARWTAILHHEPSITAEMVYRAARVKALVVSQDEREAGLRAILNFGHTFGHAVERTAGYGTFTHGEAVALGMRAALRLSHRYEPDIPLERIDQLLLRLPIPGDLRDYPLSELMASMRGDKKAESGRLHFVLLRAVGEAYVTDRPSQEEVEDAWEFARNHPVHTI